MYPVHDPKWYGVVGLDEKGMVVSIEEKPAVSKSNFTGIEFYFYDDSIVSIASQQSPSWRGELEITDVKREYLGPGNHLHVEVF